MRRIAWLAFGCCAMAGVARAQPEGGAPSEADRLFDEGRDLLKDGKWAEACDKFTKSYELDHTVGTKLNLGDCHEKQGHLRQAWQLFSEAATELDHAGNEPARAKFAHTRADALAGKLVELVVRIAQPAQPGLALAIDHRDVAPAAEVRDRFEPGDITVEARAPGRATFSTTQHGVAGATVVVIVPVLAVAGGAEAATGGRDKGRVKLAWGLAVAGGALAIGSLATSIVARGQYDTAANDATHCRKSSAGPVCDSVGVTAIHNAQHLADLGTGLAIGAGAVIAAAAIVYFTAPREGVAVAPTATAQSVGLAIAGRF